MRLLWFIGLTAGLLSACATTQPASDAANATIAKQVALADEAYELGRYEPLHRDTGKPCSTREVRTTHSSSPCSTSAHRFNRVISAKMRRSRSKKLLISISRLGRYWIGEFARASHMRAWHCGPRKRKKPLKMSSSEQGRLEIQPWRPVPLPAWPQSPLAQSLDEGEAYVIEAIALASARATRLSGLLTSMRDDSSKENADDDRALKAFKRAAQAYRAIDDHAGLASALSRQAALSVRLGG